VELPEFVWIVDYTYVYNTLQYFVDRHSQDRTQMQM
jgi:hypothetical protein